MRRASKDLSDDPPGAREDSLVVAAAVGHPICLSLCLCLSYAARYGSGPAAMRADSRVDTSSSMRAVAPAPEGVGAGPPVAAAGAQSPQLTAYDTPASAYDELSF